MGLVPYPRGGFLLVLVGGLVSILTGILDLVALTYGSALGVFDDLEAIVVSAFASFIIGVSVAGIVLGGLFVWGGLSVRRRPDRHRRRGLGILLLALVSLAGWGAALYFFGHVSVVVLAPAKLAAGTGTAGFIVGPGVALVGGLISLRWTASPPPADRAGPPREPGQVQALSDSIRVESYFMRG